MVVSLAVHDSDVTAAESQFRPSVWEDAAWLHEGTPRTQSICPESVRRTHSGDHGGSPSSYGADWDADLTRNTLQHCVNIQDTECPLCGQVLDRLCDHAAVCPCGDRNERHDASAHVFHEAAQEAGLRFQQEKAGPLQPFRTAGLTSSRFTLAPACTGQPIAATLLAKTCCLSKFLCVHVSVLLECSRVKGRHTIC